MASSGIVRLHRFAEGMVCTKRALFENVLQMALFVRILQRYQHCDRVVVFGLTFFFCCVRVCLCILVCNWVWVCIGSRVSVPVPVPV